MLESAMRLPIYIAGSSKDYAHVAEFAARLAAAMPVKITQPWWEGLAQVLAAGGTANTGDPEFLAEVGRTCARGVRRSLAVVICEPLEPDANIGRWIEAGIAYELGLPIFHLTPRPVASVFFQPYTATTEFDDLVRKLELIRQARCEPRRKFEPNESLVCYGRGPDRSVRFINYVTTTSANHPPRLALVFDIQDNQERIVGLDHLKRNK